MKYTKLNASTKYTSRSDVSYGQYYLKIMGIKRSSHPIFTIHKKCFWSRDEQLRTVEKDDRFLTYAEAGIAEALIANLNLISK